MPGTKVTEAQFELIENEVTHKPTGASWRAYPGQREAHSKAPKMLGSVLANGEDYRPHEVEEVALRLLANRPLKI